MQWSVVADGQTAQHLTTTLFFGCNALQLEDFNATAAECLRHQKLAVLSLQLHSRWEATVAACAALMGRLDEPNRSRPSAPARCVWRPGGER